MIGKYKIIDSDCHVNEPLAMWQEYLEPAYRDRAPIIGTAPAGQPTGLTDPWRYLTVGGEPIVAGLSRQYWQHAETELNNNGGVPDLAEFSSEAYLEAIAQIGSDIAFLYPTFGLWMLYIDCMESNLAGAYVRAYNNWLHNFCQLNPQILRGVGVVNQHDPKEMVSELQRIHQFGWQAVMLRPNPIKGRLLSDPLYEEFWAECARLKIAIAIHEGSHARVPSTGQDRFKTRFGIHASSVPMEHQLALIALIEGGVLERYPRLRFAFLESGCGWLPYWMWRLDREYEDLQWEMGDRLTMKPSEYIRRQVYIAVEPSEAHYISQIIDLIGSDRLLIGSDYPHIDFDPQVMYDMADLESTITAQTMGKIFWDNPCRFYGIN
ncbi:MAG: amidohydrolase [Symploca sp. SIO2E6]|nr:amidohydrolase [Symploca sp. SIO2E6]